MGSSMYCLQLLLCLCLISLTTGERRNVNRKLNQMRLEPKDSTRHFPIVRERITNLGERETRVSHKKVFAIETTEPSKGEAFPFVREAVRGNRMLWIVYQNANHIIDCNMTTDIHTVNNFMEKFTKYPLHANGARTAGKHDSHYEDITDFRTMLHACRSFQKQMKAMKRSGHKHHLKNKAQDSSQDDYLFKKTRSKRSMMIYPGTNWCGAGNQAIGGYDDLGENVATDRCCREHDHCPYMIDRFATQYNYWNYRLHTLSHCNCEERFQSCLKAADNTVANMVGYIYFNYVGSYCFTLKPEQVCKQRSWWGKCKEYDTIYTANVDESPVKFE